MTSLAAIELNTRTGPPREQDDRVAYVWMAIFAFLMLVGYLGLVRFGAL